MTHWIGRLADHSIGDVQTVPEINLPFQSEIVEPSPTRLIKPTLRTSHPAIIGRHVRQAV